MIQALLDGLGEATISLLLRASRLELEEEDAGGYFSPEV